MKISTILAYIDNGHIALPEFQRGYVWNRDQVRRLFDSLYRGHPVGGLLVWATKSEDAQYRGDGELAPGVVKLLLDGQQRITSLYGVIRGKQPEFFEGNSRAFQDLRFNLKSETFEFYQPIKMKGDPLWVDVTEVMKNGISGLGEFLSKLPQDAELTQNMAIFAPRLTRLLGINEIELHIEEVTGEGKTIDIVVDIFNRVNSGGTKLSKGDLAMAKICADWPDARDEMRAKLEELENSGYSFKLDWLLRSVNTVLTGEAKFHFLDNCSSEEIQDGLARASKYVDQCLNLISGRLGLDHTRVLFASSAVPVMVHYLDQQKGILTEKERDKLLFWFVQSGMWGRFSGSTEGYIDADIEALSEGDGKLDRLVEQLRLWRGSMRIEPGHFTGWSVGDRFYPVLYMLTRVGEARDWKSGVPLKKNLLGKGSRLEMHHIFPKAQLYKRDHNRPEVNALANFCFQTKDSNLKISDRLPEDYFPEIEANHPGALASQWIPTDPELWKIDNYLKFLEARKKLLADAANALLAELLHDETYWLESSPTDSQVDTIGVPDETIVTSDMDEDEELQGINDWMHSKELPTGELSYEHVNQESGEPLAVLDLAWPDGIQEGLTQPVAVLLNEPPEILATANQAGYRCFTSKSGFQEYIRREILVEEETA